MKKLLMIVLIAVLSTSSVAFAITAMGGSSASVEGNPTTIEKSDRVFLLSWQGDYLHTSAGTIYTKAVTVNNLTGLDKDKLSNLKELAEVKFTRNDDTVVQVDIFTAQ